MTERTPPLLAEAIARAAASLQSLSTVFMSAEEAIRLARAALEAAEPPMRRHMLHEIAEDVDKAMGNGPTGKWVAQAMRQLAKEGQ